MENEEKLRDLISSYVRATDLSKLDALAQLTSGITGASSVIDNLTIRYPQLKPELHRIVAEVRNALENAEAGHSYDYEHDQHMRVYQQQAALLEAEIERQAGDLLRREILKTLSAADDSTKRLVYLYAKEMSQTEPPRFHPDEWDWHFEAAFGPIQTFGKARDKLCALGLLNYEVTWSKKHTFYAYKVPVYARLILEKIDEHVGAPQPADAETYIIGLATENDIPRLALLELALGYSTEHSPAASISEVREHFARMFPGAFEQYSYPKPGIVARSSYSLYISHLAWQQTQSALRQAKKELVASLYKLFSELVMKARQKYGSVVEGQVVFQDNLAAYGGYLDLGYAKPLSVMITPWVTMPRAYYGEAFQQMPWAEQHQPCLIVTSDRLRSAVLHAIQSAGYRDIGLLSVRPSEMSCEIYLTGKDRSPFTEVASLMPEVGYELADRTERLRVSLFPLTRQALGDFADKGYTKDRLLEMARRFQIDVTSRYTKDEILAALIEGLGLPQFAKHIDYPGAIGMEEAPPEEVAAEKAELPKGGKSAIVELDKAKGKPGAQVHLESDAILLGADKPTRQWGVIGRCGDRPVKLDLNAPHIVTVFGKMGSGKGYTIGVISEMLCSPSIPSISEVAKEATVLVLYKPKEDVRSEFWSMTSPNDVPEEVEGLATYGASAAQLIAAENLRVFLDPQVHKKASAKFTSDYQTNNVYPLYLDPSGLRGDEWALVLSAGGSGEPLYVKRLFRIIEDLQFETFDMTTLRQAVWSDSDLDQRQKKLANQRMDILATYLEPESSGQDFTKLLAIGGVNIFDLRGTIRTPDDDFSVMTLILSLLQTKKGLEGEPFAFVINEAHSYFRRGISQEFVEAIENLIRRKRHGANWLFLDSHDPGDVDEKVVELADIKVLHFSDKTALKSAAVTRAFESSPRSFYQLGTGEALISADYSSEGSFVPLLVSIRPRLTKHGAPTKLAVD